MKYLPDTNIFIRALFGFKKEEAFLNKAFSKNEVAISVVVIGEFYAKSDAKEAETFERLVAVSPVLGIDLVTARVAADYRKQSLKQSRVQLLDCFLAAQAKLHHLTLVTGDKADFPMKDINVFSP